MRRVLAVPGVGVFLVGQTVSMLGDSALWLALGIWVKSLTGSNSAAGLVSFAFLLGTLTGPLTGLLVDRLPVRSLLVATNLLVVPVLLTLWWVTDAAGIWQIYGVALCYGVVNSLLDSGRSAVLFSVLPEELLAHGNSLLQTARQGLRLLAPLVGAGLFSLLGPHVVVALDASTFLVSAFTLLFLPVRPLPARLASRVAWRQEFGAGVRHIIGTPVLRQVLTASVVALLAFGFVETVFFAVVDQGLHRPAAFMGVLMAVEAGGALLASVAAPVALRRISEGVLVGWGLFQFATASVLLMSGHEAVALGGAATAGFSLPWIVVGITTLLQRRTPPDLQGRVYSAFEAITNTPQTLSIALGAALIAVVDYRILLAVMAVFVATAGSYLLTRPEQRRTDSPSKALQ